jgi:hypothetical protein
MKTDELIRDRKDRAARHQKWVYMFFEKLIKNMRSEGLINVIESANPIVLYPTKKYAKKFIWISITHTNLFDICKLIGPSRSKWNCAHQYFTINVERERSYGCKFIIYIEDDNRGSDSKFANVPAYVIWAYHDKPEDLSQNSAWLCKKVKPIIDKTMNEMKAIRSEEWDRVKDY